MTLPGRIIGLAFGAFALVALVSGTARAATIVLESYIGARPEDADRYISPVLAELGGRGYVVGVDGVGKAYEAIASRPGVGVDAETLAAFGDQVQLGFLDWTDGNFEQAIEILGGAVLMAQAAPAALAIDPDLRTAYLTALVGLALAHKRLGHQEEAATAMTELLRSFSSDPIPWSYYGPEAQKLFKQVAKSLASQPTGSLKVSVDDPDAVIFVNETFSGISKVELATLVPGTYRVLVRKGEGEGRSYRVDVTGKETATLDVIWKFDNAIHTSPGWVGFVFADKAASEEHLSPFSARIARALGADSIVVVSIGEDAGVRAVQGAVLTIDSAKPVRTATVALEPVEPSETRLRALGAFLAGDVAALEEVERREAPPAPSATSSSSRWLAWSGMAAGAVGIGVGIYLLAIDGSCIGPDPVHSQCPELWETSWAGLGAVVAGAVLGATSAYVAVRGHPRRSVPAVTVVLNQDGARVLFGRDF